MKRLSLVMAAALLLASAPAVAGQGAQGDWEFGPYVGFAWLDDYDALEPDNNWLYGARLGYFFTPEWSLEASWQRLNTEFELSGADRDMRFTSTRLNGLYNFRAGSACRPFVTVGIGNENADARRVGDSTDTSLNAGGGARWFFTDRFGLRGDARYVSVAVGDGIRERQGNFEATVGVLWALGGGAPPDADNDGVPDRKDKCPGTPVGAKVDGDGCPIDSDGDGVYDGIDKCADTPKGWPVDASGCPKDTDGDGVVDGQDACPDTPRGAKVDARGCTSDSDGDGVFDGLDRCPDTPRGARVDAYGCPVDSDHDGVADGIDKCPDTRHGAKVDATGCEIVEKAAPLFVEGKKTLVLEGVNFETNKADLLPESIAVLERVAKALADWPEVKVEVGGHTDSRGGSGYNMELSQRRAAKVKAYLEAKGIDPARLSSKGYGETKAIADNKTDEGRAKNRRVELTRVD